MPIMPMSLGDFFKSAPNARPVNPRPVNFTAVSKGTILPSGDANPHKVPVAANVKAALVFIGGDGNEQARVEARRALAARAVDKKTGESYFDQIDLSIEIGYQTIFRALRQWDEKLRELGDRLFDSVEQCRDLLEVAEAGRLLAAYNKYVADEHPADEDANGKEGGVDRATFRGAKV